MRRSTVRLVGVCTAHRITRKKAVHTGARALQGSEERGAPEASHVVPLCFQQPLVTQEEDLCRCIHVAPGYGALPLPSLLWAVEFLTCPVFRRLAAVTYAPELAAGEEDSCVSSPHSPMLTAISWGQPARRRREEHAVLALSTAERQWTAAKVTGQRVLGNEPGSQGHTRLPLLHQQRRHCTHNVAGFRSLLLFYLHVQKSLL